MVWHLAKKDFLNNVVSARFVIGFVLCLVLIPFCILVNIDDFREKSRLHQSDRDMADKSTKQVRVYSALRPEIVLPPEPLSIFSKGISDRVGNRIKIWLGEKPMLAGGRPATRDNPFLDAFFPVDFVDIATIVFSLLALLFSYDAFTREKEQGTLKLQMSNALSRSRVLNGKLVGILLTLLPVLVFCFLLGAALILLSKAIVFAVLDWVRLILLAVASLLYLTVFIYIGLLVSARSRTSISSLVICLLLWVLLVFLIPNLSSYFAESFVRVQSQDNLNRVLASLDEEMNARLAEFAKTLPEPESTHYTYIDYGHYQGGADGYKEMYRGTRPILERERQLSAYSEPLRIDYAEKKWASERAFLESLDRQARIGNALSMISPAGVFRIFASSICATDRRTHEKTLDSARRYRETFISYFRGKDIFRSFAWITPTPPKSFLTADEIVERRTGGEFKTLETYNAWAVQQKDTFVRYQKLQKVKVPGDQPTDYPYLNVNDMPVYEKRPLSLLAVLGSNAIRLGLLAIEGIFLFYLGYVAFIRYDVR